ncbi:hypothetical protein EJB05_39071, partial [Eragrostis curvula]
MGPPSAVTSNRRIRSPRVNGGNWPAPSMTQLHNASRRQNPSLDTMACSGHRILLRNHQCHRLSSAFSTAVAEKLVDVHKLLPPPPRHPLCCPHCHPQLRRALEADPARGMGGNKGKSCRFNPCFIPAQAKPNNPF